MSYTKQLEDGMMKLVKENWLLKAEGFHEAEQRLTEELSSDGDYNIMAIKKTQYMELLCKPEDITDSVTEPLWYMVRVVIMVPDERTGKEKKTYCDHLIRAFSVKEARNAAEELYKDCVEAHRIHTVKESNISEVLKV